MVSGTLSVTIEGNTVIDGYAISITPPEMNYISFGRDFITSSSGDFGFDPRYDNISVAVAGEGDLELQINAASGYMRMVNTSDQFNSPNFDLYQIISPAGSLDSVNWNSLDEQDYDSNGSGTGQNWDVGGGSGSGILIEGFLLGSSSLDPEEVVSLGRGYGSSVADANLTFEYRRADSGELVSAAVTYIVPGDMDDDGDVDEFDVPLFVQALVNRAVYESAYPNVDADFVGDFDGNGLLDAGDIALFSGAVAASASAQSSAVPEPASGLLLVLSSCCLLGTRRSGYFRGVLTRSQDRETSK